MTLGLILYVATAILVGMYGRDRRIGFLGCFLFSLLLTPPLFFLLLILTAPRTPPVAAAPQKKA
jgi:hypothetical protein